MTRAAWLAPWAGVVLLLGCGGKNGAGEFDCLDPNTCPSMASCPSGALRCGPDHAVQRCNDAGTSWDDIAHCLDGQSCAAGQCGPSACTGNATRCTEDGRIAMCLPAVGQYSDPHSCPVGQVCIGTGCIPQVCSPNQRFCIDGMTVGQCDALGDNATVIDRCTGNAACAAGGCVDACQAADINKTFAGCTFYSLDMDNYDFDDSHENDIAVANESTFTANVKIQVRQGATNWATLCQGPVGPGQTHVFPLTSTCAPDAANPIDRHVEDSALVTALAYRVVSDAPIVAYQYNSDDLDRGAASSGATVLLPKSTLGKKYYVLTWPQPDPATSGNLTGSDISRSSMDVIATTDVTQVTVRSSTHVMAGVGVSMMGPGEMQTFMLNEGDVLQLETLMTGDDLTGTFVEADKPIALFAGVECAVNVDPRSGTFGNYCDHAEEQILPLVAWGKHYVAPRVVPQANSDGCFGGGPPETDCAPSRWRILGSVDGTHVSLNAPTGVTFDQPGPFTLNAGAFQDLLAMGVSPQAPGDFFISADQPILVMQLSGGEATMTTAVPVEQYLSFYLFQVPDFFCSNLTVIRSAGAMVQSDGMIVADSLFNPAGGDPMLGNFEVAHFPLNMTVCGAGSTGSNTPHTVRAQAGPEGRASPVGIVVSGMDSNCSYSYVGGLNINVINPVE